MSNHALRTFIARWDVPFAVATVILYGAAIPVLIVAFPDVSNLTISILVLLSGFTGSLSALAALLKEPASEKVEKPPSRWSGPPRYGNGGHVMTIPTMLPSQRPMPRGPVPDERPRPR